MLSDVITYKHQIEAYKTWVRETAILLAKVSGQRVDLVAIGIQAEEIVNFESELAKVCEIRRMLKSVVAKC